jgi:hypothetical protein
LPSGAGETLLICLPLEHPLNSADIDALQYALLPSSVSIIVLRADISQIPATHHLTFTHPSYNRGYDYAFISSFVDAFVREGRDLSASIQDSLQPGRLSQTNVVIKTGGDCVKIVYRKADGLWLGAKSCCPQSCLMEKQNIVTCENCHSAMKLPTCLTYDIGDFVDRYQKPKTRGHGVWYLLPPEPPVWSNGVAVTDPPAVRTQRKRRRSDDG